MLVVCRMGRNFQLFNCWITTMVLKYEYYCVCVIDLLNCMIFDVKLKFETLLKIPFAIFCHWSKGLLLHEYEWLCKVFFLINQNQITNNNIYMYFVGLRSRMDYLLIFCCYHCELFVYLLTVYFVYKTCSIVTSGLLRVYYKLLNIANMPKN